MPMQMVCFVSAVSVCDWIVRWGLRPWDYRDWVYLETGGPPMRESVMGNSMDSDLLSELSGETWLAATHLDEATGDLSPSDSEPDLIMSSRMDKTWTVVRE